MKTIIITGTPGTGKSTLSKQLVKILNFTYLDVNKIIIKHNLSVGLDKKRRSKIINIKKLNKALIKEIKDNKYAINKRLIKKTEKKLKNGLIIDSHLSHYLPKKYVDLCIVAKCNLKNLKNRLKKKKYSTTFCVDEVCYRKSIVFELALCLIGLAMIFRVLFVGFSAKDKKIKAPIAMD